MFTNYHKVLELVNSFAKDTIIFQITYRINTEYWPAQPLWLTLNNSWLWPWWWPTWRGGTKLLWLHMDLDSTEVEAEQKWLICVIFPYYLGRVWSSNRPSNSKQEWIPTEKYCCGILAHFWTGWLGCSCQRSTILTSCTSLWRCLIRLSITPTGIMKGELKWTKTMFFKFWRSLSWVCDIYLDWTVSLILTGKSWEEIQPCSAGPNVWQKFTKTRGWQGNKTLCAKWFLGRTEHSAFMSVNIKMLNTHKNKSTLWRRQHCLFFFGQHVCFCQAATHLLREHSLSDDSVGIIKKKGYQEGFC